MKFGKEFRNHLEETIPEWRDKFLCYKLLKKLLKHFPSSAADGLQSNQFPLASAAVDSIDDRSDNGSGSSVHLQDWFIRILNEELEKFNDFFVDREEDFIIRFQELKERIERVKEKSGGRFTLESEFSEEIMEIRKDFVTIHGEMVLLKNYSSLNFAGLVKILKKYDKRTGGLLQLPFTQVALNQPFFITESLTRLVRECEANLELLFPLEAEVIESTSTPQEDSNPQSNNNTGNTNTSSHGTSNIGNETLDVYRSTLAAMKAIRGLQKASSTSNPLSFSSLSNKDDDDVGAVTAENSASSSPTTISPTTLINGDHDQDDIHSK